MMAKPSDDLSLKGLTLLEFWSEWCLYSRLLKPKSAYVADRYKGRVEVKRVDAGRHQDWADRYEVEFVPAFVLFHNGRIEAKWYGDTPIRAITEELDRHV